MASEASNCINPCQFLTTKDYITILWTTFAEFPGLFIASCIADLLGRKPTIGLSMLVFCVSSFCLIACLERTMITVLLFVGRGMILASFMTLYVYTPEVHPTAIRALGIGTCVACSRLGTILTPFVAQVVSTRVAAAIYALLALLGCIAVLLLPKETKGQRLQDSVIEASYPLEMMTNSESIPEKYVPLLTEKVNGQSASEPSPQSRISVVQESTI